MEERRSGDFDYEVAISFAGEDRGVAERIAGLLKADGVKVFYDKYEEADLWGKDLYEHLADIYSNKARFCLVPISAHYAKKLWTVHELRNAFVRSFQENEEYILPLMLDDTRIPGIRKTIGYQDLRSSSVEKIVELVKAKLGKPSSEKDDRQALEQPQSKAFYQSIQYFVGGQSLLNEGTIRRSIDGNFVSAFNVKIDIHNSIEKQLRPASFRIGIILHDENVTMRGDFKEFRQPDHNMLFIMTKEFRMTPGSWDYIAPVFIRKDGSNFKKGDSFSIALRLFYEDYVRDFPFQIVIT